MGNHLNYMLGELAEFNRNGQLLTAKLLSNLEEGELTKETGSYFDNLEKMFAHLVEAQYLVMTMIAKALPEMNLPNEKLDNLSFAEAVKRNQVMCDVLVKMAKEISSDQLEREMQFHGQDCTVQWVMLKIFNHSTHHRGQISQVLDSLKIEHDLIRMTPTL